MTEAELTTPRPMPTTYRVLAIATQVENGEDIYNSGPTYQVLPITSDAPEDSLAATKNEASVRHYTHEYSLPEGWTIWEWEDFDGYEFSPRYEVRNVEGHALSAERIYTLAAQKGETPVYQPDELIV